MNIDDIKLMYEYNNWANEAILTMAEQVSPEQLMLPRSFSWGGLYGTLVHNLDTEYGWRMLCQHGELSFDLKPEDFPDLTSIRTRWSAEKGAMWAYLNSLSDDDLQSIVSYEVEEGKRTRVLWHCLWHVVNHGMQHRSECAIMLTDLGKSPGSLDFTAFLNERAGS